MYMKSALAAIAALAVSVASALALDSSKTVSSPLSPNALWKKISDFCGMTSWHPAVERCDLSADGKQRTIFLFGSARTVVEGLENWDDANHSFTYTIVSGLLPVANYHATISVIGSANGSTLTFAVGYEARGVPDADAKTAVDTAIYRSLCYNSPLLCSPDQRSVPPAETVQLVFPPARHR